jgi:hypothetical protein
MWGYRHLWQAHSNIFVKMIYQEFDCPLTIHTP